MSFSESSKSTFIHNPGEGPGVHSIRGVLSRVKPAMSSNTAERAVVGESGRSPILLSSFCRNEDGGETAVSCANTANEPPQRVISDWHIAHPSARCWSIEERSDSDNNPKAYSAAASAISSVNCRCGGILLFTLRLGCWISRHRILKRLWIRKSLP